MALKNPVESFQGGSWSYFFSSWDRPSKREITGKKNLKDGFRLEGKGTLSGSTVNGLGKSSGP